MTENIKGKSRHTNIFIDVLFINNLKIQGRAVGWLVARQRLGWANRAGRWTESLVAQHREKPMSAEHCGMSTGCLESQRQVWKPRSPCKRSEQVRNRIGTHTGEDWRGVRRGKPTLTLVAIHPLSLGTLITSSVLLTTPKLDTTFSSLQMKPTFRKLQELASSEVPGVTVGTWPLMHWTSKLKLIPLPHWPKYAERPSVDWQPCGLAPQLARWLTQLQLDAHSLGGCPDWRLHTSWSSRGMSEAEREGYELDHTPPPQVREMHTYALERRTRRNATQCLHLCNLECFPYFHKDFYNVLFISS